MNKLLILVCTFFSMSQAFGDVVFFECKLKTLNSSPESFSFEIFLNADIVVGAIENDIIEGEHTTLNDQMKRVSFNLEDGTRYLEFSYKTGELDKNRKMYGRLLMGTLDETGELLYTDVSVRCLKMEKLDVSLISL